MSNTPSTPLLLVTLSAAHDGSYKDDQGKQQHLSDIVLEAIQGMKIGQKVLIVAEKEEKDREEFLGKRGKERRI
jgi:hypothetical protein